MTGLIFHNWPYKVLALLMAVALWSVIRSQVTDTDPFTLPVEVQFVKSGDGGDSPPISYSGRPELETVEVELEGSESELTQFGRLPEDARALIAVIDAAQLDPERPADHVTIRVENLGFPSAIEEGRLRFKGAKPQTVRIAWRRIVEAPSMAVSRDVVLPNGWSPPDPDVQMTLRPVNTRLHVRGPQAQLDDQTLALELDEDDLEEAFRDLGDKPALLQTVAARLTSRFSDVQVIGSQPTVEIELNNRTTADVKLPVRLFVLPETAESFDVDFTAAAKAKLDAQTNAKLVGSRTALEEQRRRIQEQDPLRPEVYLWVNAAEADRTEDSPRAPVHVHGLPEGVTVEGLATRKVGLQFGARTD